MMEINRDDFEESIVNIGRVTKVVKGGRRFRFTALIVVGEKEEFHTFNPRTFIKKNDNLLLTFDLLTKNRFINVVNELNRQVFERNTIGVATIVLVDNDLVKAIPKGITLEYLIP